MKGLYCAIFLVVCLGVSACGNVFNDQLEVRTEEQEPWKGERNTDAEFFCVMDGVGYDTAEKVLEEEDGSILIAGITRTYGAGESDAWLVMTDPFGNIMWQKTLGWHGIEWVNTMKRMPGGGYIIAGETGPYAEENQDLWLVRLTGSFEVMWERTYGGEERDTAIEVFPKEDGKLVIMGNTDSSGMGGTDAWVIHTDADGKIINETTHGLDKTDYLRASTYNHVTGKYILAVNSGSYDDYFTMVKVIQVTSAGERESDITMYGGRGTTAFGIMADADGEIVVVGGNFNIAQNRMNPWAAKLDSKLNIIWEKEYPFAGAGQLTKALEKNDGTYTFTGATNTGKDRIYDAILMKVSENGSVLKAMTVGGNDMDSIDDAVLTTNGGIIAVGATRSYGTGYFSMMLLKLDDKWDIDGNDLCVLEWGVIPIGTNTKVTKNPLTEINDKAHDGMGEAKSVFNISDAVSRFIR